MKDDVIVLKWPGWRELRAAFRAVLGVRVQAGEPLHEAQERRYKDISRCC